jgi:hypothetical protein
MAQYENLVQSRHRCGAVPAQMWAGCDATAKLTAQGSAKKRGPHNAGSSCDIGISVPLGYS